MWIIHCITIILKRSVAFKDLLYLLLLAEDDSVSFLDTQLSIHVYHKSNRNKEQWLITPLWIINYMLSIFLIINIVHVLLLPFYFIFWWTLMYFVNYSFVLLFWIATNISNITTTIIPYVTVLITITSFMGTYRW